MHAALALHDKLSESRSFGQALDAAVIHSLLREGMHIKEIDLGLTSTRAHSGHGCDPTHACGNISVGHLV